MLKENDLSYLLQVLLEEFEDKPVNFVVFLFAHKMTKDSFVNWSNVDLEKLYELLMADEVQNLPAKELSRLHKVNKFFFIELIQFIAEKDYTETRGVVPIMHKLYGKLLDRGISLCDKERLQSISKVESYLEQF